MAVLFKELFTHETVSFTLGNETEANAMPVFIGRCVRFYFKGGYSVRKRILPILLLISPYLFIIFAVICSQYLSENIFQYLYLFYFGFVFVICIPNMIYPFVMLKHREDSAEILSWDMLLKLINIPINIIVILYEERFI